MAFKIAKTVRPGHCVIKALALLLSAAALVSLDAPVDAGEPLSRIRSSSQSVRELFEEGVRQSATFRALADAIDRSDGIVYVEFGVCAFGHLSGCVLPYLVPAGGQRFLRIIVTSDKSRVSHDQLLALIAHELQHAREILESKEVVDVVTMDRMYHRIGTPLPGGTGYETSAARAAGNAVLNELHAAALKKRLAAQASYVIAADTPGLFTRVRSTERFVIALIREGYARSRTFSQLVDTLQSSSAIVLVQPTTCAGGRIRSCLVSVSEFHGQRHIRIMVDPRTSHDALIATVAHELQHAVEVVEHADVVDAPSLVRLYRQIAFGRCREGLSEECETERALATERKVLEELSYVERKAVASGVANDCDETVVSLTELAHKKGSAQ